MSSASTSPAASPNPFRRAVWRGLGVVLPPLLTIVILFWIGTTVKQYGYDPVIAAAREILYLKLNDIRTNLPDSDPSTPETTTADGVYVRIDGRNYVPLEVVQTLRERLDGRPLPATAADVYRQYVQIEYLKPYVVIPVFLMVLVLVLYLLGKVLAIGVGRFFWGLFEKGVGSLPLVNSVYSSVKQVTDLMFSEREMAYTRIVALQFPSKGMWSVGFVTSESLLQIESAAAEPVVAVLIPYSPMPITGCLVTVRKSETIDLNITLDQAFQFIVSCGVVVPPQQMSLRRRVALIPANKTDGEERGDKVRG